MQAPLAAPPPSQARNPWARNQPARSACPRKSAEFRGCSQRQILGHIANTKPVQINEVYLRGGSPRPPTHDAQVAGGAALTNRARVHKALAATAVSGQRSAFIPRGNFPGWPFLLPEWDPVKLRRISNNVGRR